MTDQGETSDPSFSIRDGPSEPAIRIRDLHKSFGPRAVLRGFTLDVPRREMLAIVGASGCGKSVLLKLLSGLIRPDRGSLIVEGQEIAGASDEQLREIHRKIGYLFQEGGLLNSLTIFDNIALPLREVGRLTEAQIAELVRDRLRQVDVLEAEKKYPRELSGGMRKRAGLARAIVEQRSLFFFDEPTSALDPVSAASIRSLVREVHDEWNSTSLVVTHDLILVSGVADRVAFLHEGKVLQTGTFEELSSSENAVVREFFAAGGCVRI